MVPRPRLSGHRALLSRQPLPRDDAIGAEYKSCAPHRRDGELHGFAPGPVTNLDARSGLRKDAKRGGGGGGGRCSAFGSLANGPQSVITLAPPTRVRRAITRHANDTETYGAISGYG